MWNSVRNTRQVKMLRQKPKGQSRYCLLLQSDINLQILDFWNGFWLQKDLSIITQYVTLIKILSN